MALLDNRTMSSQKALAGRDIVILVSPASECNVIIIMANVMISSYRSRPTSSGDSKKVKLMAVRRSNGCDLNIRLRFCFRLPGDAAAQVSEAQANSFLVGEYIQTQ